MRRASSGGRSAFTLTDLVVVTVLVLVSAVALLGWQANQRKNANRTKCAAHLRSLGQAMLLYANENRGAYPRTVHDATTAGTPTWGTGAAADDPFAPGGPAPNDVSAALFLVIRTQDTGTEMFSCPAGTQEKDKFHGEPMLSRSNFTDVATNLSYGYANPYPDQQAIERKFAWNLDVAPEMALAADRGPSLAKVPALATISTASPAAPKRTANSTNHGGDGQNVLYGDGHVEFQTDPLVGMRNDNIYTRSAVDAKGGLLGDGSSDRATPISSPATASDSVILPLAP